MYCVFFFVFNGLFLGRNSTCSTTFDVQWILYWGWKHIGKLWNQEQVYSDFRTKRGIILVYESNNFFTLLFCNLGHNPAFDFANAITKTQSNVVDFYLSCRFFSNTMDSLLFGIKYLSLFSSSSTKSCQSLDFSITNSFCLYVCVRLAAWDWKMLKQSTKSTIRKRLVWPILNRKRPMVCMLDFTGSASTNVSMYDKSSPVPKKKWVKLFNKPKIRYVPIRQSCGTRSIRSRSFFFIPCLKILIRLFFIVLKAPSTISSAIMGSGKFHDFNDFWTTSWTGRGQSRRASSISNNVSQCLIRVVNTNTFRPLKHNWEMMSTKASFRFVSSHKSFVMPAKFGTVSPYV